jgi:hypothetical protein
VHEAQLHEGPTSHSRAKQQAADCDRRKKLPSEPTGHHRDDISHFEVGEKKTVKEKRKKGGRKEVDMDLDLSVAFWKSSLLHCGQ